MLPSPATLLVLANPSPNARVLSPWRDSLKRIAQIKQTSCLVDNCLCDLRISQKFKISSTFQLIVLDLLWTLGLPEP